MASKPKVKDDSIRRQVLLEGLKENEAKKFQKFLKGIEKDVRNRLSEEGVTINNRKRLQALLDDTTALQKEALEKFTGQLKNNLTDLAVTEADLEVGLLSKVQKVFQPVLPDRNQILTAFRENPLSISGRGAGFTLDKVLEDFTRSQIDIVNGRIAQGFAQGQTTAEIISGVRGTAEMRFTDGALAAVEKNAKMMVRTAVQNASSMARQAVWEENSDVIIGVEWVSTLDSRTTEQCQALDGEIFPVDSGPRPPIHYNCRSTTAPVLKEDLAVLSEGGNRPAKGEFKNGKTDIQQVSAKTTYYEWLKTQPASFQDKVLGQDKAKLFRDGGLNAEKFRALQLNKNFQPISLEDMAREVPEAFKKANLDDYLPN